MEKDHFLDRHPQSQDRSKINRGDKVFICLKKAQPYAKELDDLTIVTVTANLTSQNIHPRGQKVKGLETVINNNGEEEQIERVGRVVYKIENNSQVLTTEGIKYIYQYSENKTIKHKLVSFNEIKDCFSLFVFLRFDNFIFEFPISPWVFLHENEIQPYVNTLFFSDFVLMGGSIYYILNGMAKKEINFISHYNNQAKNEDNQKVIEFISNNYTSKNNTKESYNKIFNLEFIGIQARKIPPPPLS